MELVSCIIPTFKRSDMLTRAIDSVLAQTYRNVEALVVDDNEPGSPESLNVKRIVCTYNDERVKYIGQEKHINGAVARNEGIRQSRGAYIAFLDDDDEWLPQKVEKQVEYLENNKEYQGVTCLYSIFSKGIEIRKCTPYTEEELQFKVLSHQISMYTSTFLCKKDTLIQSGAFNPQLLRNQDLQMFADFLSFGNIHPINDYLVVLHNDSTINRKGLQKTIDAKEAFFMVENNNIMKYDIRHRNRIYSAHYFDIVVNALRMKRFSIALKYLMKMNLNIEVLKDIYTRVQRRKNS